MQRMELPPHARCRAVAPFDGSTVSSLRLEHSVRARPADSRVSLSFSADYGAAVSGARTAGNGASPAHSPLSRLGASPAALSAPGSAAHGAAVSAARASGDGARPGPRDGATTRKTKAALSSKSRTAKRWLGQHYMVDDEVTLRSVDLAAVEPGDVVLEVGPGTGVLTEALLAAGAYVVAVEKDPDMVEITRERLPASPNLQLIHCDVMKWPVEAEMRRILQEIAGSTEPVREGQEAGVQAAAAPVGKGKEAGGHMRRAKIVANLPFNITSEFLQTILPLGDLFSTAVLMLQDEAAQRLVDARPGAGDYRKMNLFIGFFSVPSYALFVDRRKFLPPPKFHCAVVRFDLKRSSEYRSVTSMKGLFQLINQGFSVKRKMLRSSLASLHPAAAVESALIDMGLPPTARPEELGLDQFVGLYEKLLALEAAQAEAVPVVINENR